MNQNQNNDPKNDGPKNRQSLLVLLVCITDQSGLCESFKQDDNQYDQ